VGSLQVQEFASLTAAGDVSLEQSLAWHLRANHYPPVPLSMIEPCIQAIEIGQRYQWGDADLNDRVDLPDGVLWRGEENAPAWAIIEAHHLDAFIQSEEEE
jgi:hypothetical protein